MCCCSACPQAQVLIVSFCRGSRHDPTPRQRVVGPPPKQDAGRWTQGDQQGRMTKRAPRTRAGLSSRSLRARPHHPCPTGGARTRSPTVGMNKGWLVSVATNGGDAKGATREQWKQSQPAVTGDAPYFRINPIDERLGQLTGCPRTGARPDSRHSRVADGAIAIGGPAHPPNRQIRRRSLNRDPEMPRRAFGTKFRVYCRFRTLNPQQLRTRYVRWVKYVGRGRLYSSPCH